ncbi:MAG TPA: fibronectin type III domain-containing protein, partial [Pirellulaceae bacterium]|nr:fibronectin type III domain-containing protein [Pirellulaceae bacterium]
NSTSASQGFVAADEFQTLTLSGTSGGSLTPAFGGVSATTAVTRTDEVQTLTLLGAAGDTVHLSFGGTSGSDATELTFAGGNLPTAPDVQSHLNSIPTLTGNVLVASSVSGVYTVKFRGGLTGANVSQIAALTTGTATASVVTTTQGSSPTAAQVQASLTTIASLAGNVTVTGNTGGPYSIQIRNLGNVAPIDVSTITGGLTALIGTVTDGLDGVNDDFDQLTSVASHELAEAVTDPDVNYKTLGWFDDANNVEIGDLTLTSIADRLATSTRLNGFYTQHLFAQDHTIAGPDATSTPFVAVNGSTALQNVTVQTLTLSRAQVSWTPVAGAVGYRVLLVNGTQTTLLSRVAAPATSTILTGLPQLVTQSLRVEAYNAANVTDPVTMSLTMPLPNVVAPQSVKATALSSTSVLLTWTGNGGAAGYRIFLISGTKKFLVATASEAATSATISGLTAGTKVSFRVEAFRGSKIADSALVSLTLSTPALAAPTVTIAAVGGNNSVAQLSWNTVAGAKGYRVYYLKGNQRILLSSLGASATTTKISGLPAGTQFSVQAFSGSRTAVSKWVHL